MIKCHQFIGFVLLSGALVLSGCSSRRGPQATGGLQVGGEQGGGSGASAYGAGEQGVYAQQGLGSGFQDQRICQPAPPTAGVNQHYFFGFDKNNVRQNAMQSLQNQAQYIVDHANIKVRIEGNTDDRGSREYNIALGWRRTKAIANVLEQYGVARKQLVLVSYGAEKPAVFGHTEQSYQCNRRVDLKY